MRAVRVKSNLLGTSVVIPSVTRAAEELGISVGYLERKLHNHTVIFPNGAEHPVTVRYEK